MLRTSGLVAALGVFGTMLVPVSPADAQTYVRNGLRQAYPAYAYVYDDYYRTTTGPGNDIDLGPYGAYAAFGRVTPLPYRVRRGGLSPLDWTAIHGAGADD